MDFSKVTTCNEPNVRKTHYENKNNDLDFLEILNDVFYSTKRNPRRVKKLIQHSLRSDKKRA